jgi:DHA2 family methylenomycin A resistance protein-like MFS transporter
MGRRDGKNLQKERLENLMSTTHRTSQVITLVVTCLGLFMVFLDGSIVNVALATIQSDLHAQLSDLQWVVDAYTLPFAALMLTAGTLADRFGRKRLFLGGLVLFVLGSLLCGLAPTLGWLLAGRAVQGVGAAALSPGSLAVLVAAFADPRKRAQAIGLWAGISGIGWPPGHSSAFVLVEARVRDPMLPLSLFRNRVFSVANGAGLLLGFVMMGTIFFYGGNLSLPSFSSRARR